MGEGQGSRSEAEEDDLGCRTQADSGGAAGAVGEGEEGSVKNIEPGR